MPTAVHDESVWSSRFTRGRRDQEQVNELKRLAYANGVEELTAGYLR